MARGKALQWWWFLQSLYTVHLSSVGTVWLVAVPSVLFSRVHISAVLNKKRNGQNLWADCSEDVIASHTNCCQTCLRCYHLYRLRSSYLSEVLWLWINTEPRNLRQTQSNSVVLQVFEVWAAFVYRERAERCQSGNMQSLARAMFYMHHINICTKSEFLC